MNRPFRILLPMLLVSAQGLTAAAQSSAATTEWDRLRGLPEHTSLTLSTEQGKAHCMLVRASAEQITCENRSYPRSDIRTVKLARHGASTVHGLLVGLGIGVGGGAIVGAALGRSAFSTPGRGAAVGIAIFAPLGAGIGAGVGRAADHASRTIYQR